MNLVISALWLAFAVGLTACSTSSPRVITTPIRQGMTGAELVSAFGQPLRIERRYSYGHTTTTTTTMIPRPVHLSPAGRVVGAIPAGHVISE